MIEVPFETRTVDLPPHFRDMVRARPGRFGQPIVGCRRYRNHAVVLNLFRSFANVLQVSV